MAAEPRHADPLGRREPALLAAPAARGRRLSAGVLRDARRGRPADRRAPRADRQRHRDPRLRLALRAGAHRPRLRRGTHLRARRRHRRESDDPVRRSAPALGARGRARPLLDRPRAARRLQVRRPRAPRAGTRAVPRRCRDGRGPDAPPDRARPARRTAAAARPPPHGPRGRRARAGHGSGAGEDAHRRGLRARARHPRGAARAVPRVRPADPPRPRARRGPRGARVPVAGARGAPDPPAGGPGAPDRGRAQRLLHRQRAPHQRREALRGDPRGRHAGADARLRRRADPRRPRDRRRPGRRRRAGGPRPRGARRADRPRSTAT